MTLGKDFSARDKARLQWMSARAARHDAAVLDAYRRMVVAMLTKLTAGSNSGVRSC